MKATEEELAAAKRLKIEGAEQMTGPELREAIRRARIRVASLREGRDEHNKWVAMCTALGARIQAGRGTPTTAELKRFYKNELPAALATRGIVEGARITLPPGCGLAKSGRATVGKVWPMAHDRITITLIFDGERAHAYDAWLVWRHATNIHSRPGRR